MAIGAILTFGTEVIEIRILNGEVFCRNSTYGSQLVPFENLYLSKAGVTKEFPDLENNPEWRRLAIERFNEKIKSFKDEDDALQYLVDDLKKYGYIPKYKQRDGFRVVAYK